MTKVEIAVERAGINGKNDTLRSDKIFLKVMKQHDFCVCKTGVVRFVFCFIKLYLICLFLPEARKYRIS